MTDGHRVIRPWAISVFWKDGVAVDCFDSHNKVEVSVPGHEFAGMTFESSHGPDYCRFLSSLEAAFIRGKAAKAEEVRQLLGIPGPPSPGWKP